MPMDIKEPVPLLYLHTASSRESKHTRKQSGFNTLLHPVPIFKAVVTCFYTHRLNRSSLFHKEETGFFHLNKLKPENLSTCWDAGDTGLNLFRKKRKLSQNLTTASMPQLVVCGEKREEHHLYVSLLFFT